MPPLGIISGPMLLKSHVLGKLKPRMVETPFGPAMILLSDEVAFIPRHGLEGEPYILPHRINHAANMAALRNLGVRCVVSANSTGSLKPDLPPGTLVVPDDYIMTTAYPTVFHDRPVHVTPGLSGKLRREWLSAAEDCGRPAVDGGVYWHTVGPRFETKAEVRMAAAFADIVGMTLGGEASVAKELDLEYASLCSVDNFAHGIGGEPLTMNEIVRCARENAEAVVRIVKRLLEKRRDNG
ncbi:MAG: MTAP family purine nucleoside phosphorylase [Syntrophaceae bacterium]|nr:MTAP family purine nucleoside phosphorylase [Syntrophaceae bacterium]